MPISMELSLAPDAPTTGPSWWKMPSDLLDLDGANEYFTRLLAYLYHYASHDGSLLPEEAWPVALAMVSASAQIMGRQSAAYRRDGPDPRRAQAGMALRARLRAGEVSRFALPHRLKKAQQESYIPGLLPADFPPAPSEGAPAHEVEAAQEARFEAMERTPQNMTDMAAAFFQSLLTPDPVDREAQDRLLEYSEARLSEEDADGLETEYTLAELTKAMQACNADASPGPNGLGMKFFRATWPTAGPLLLDVLNRSAVTGALPPCHRRRHIVLLPKPGDAARLANKRPISLLDCQTRIIAKAVTIRLKGVINSVIGPDQRGFMPRRWIGDSTANVQALFDPSPLHVPRGYLAVIDQMKAYDRVSHEWLGRVLEHCGFGPRIRASLRALYAGGSASVLVNGFVSPAIAVNCSVPQGSSVACFLYNLSLEPLAAAVRARLQGVSCLTSSSLPAVLRAGPPMPLRAPFDATWGIPLPYVPPPPEPVQLPSRIGSAREVSEERAATEAAVTAARAPDLVFRINLFADDIAIGCADADDLDRLGDLLRLFEAASNARRNVSKSFLAPLGNAPDPPPALLAAWPVERGNTWE